MSATMNAFEALARVPGWDTDTVSVEELKGGLTNRTYYVQDKDRRCVLRLDSEQAVDFQFTRSCELAVQADACRAGLAPEIIHADADAGILVSEYLPGYVWQEHDLQSTAKLESLAGLLRRVHALPLCGTRNDMTDVAVQYERYLERGHGLHAFASRCVAIVSSIPVRDDVACCHNDIVAANVIEDSTLKLIDWEFACDNDPLFDLASAIGFHNLDARRSDILLSAYAGGSDGALRAQLAEQVRLFDAIQWLWLAARHLVLPSRWQARRLEELQQRIN